MRLWLRAGEHAVRRLMGMAGTRGKRHPLLCRQTHTRNSQHFTEHYTGSLHTALSLYTAWGVTVSHEHGVGVKVTESHFPLGVEAAARR